MLIIGITSDKEKGMMVKTTPDHYYAPGMFAGKSKHAIFKTNGSQL